MQPSDGTTLPGAAYSGTFTVGSQSYSNLLLSDDNTYALFSSDATASDTGTWAASRSVTEGSYVLTSKAGKSFGLTVSGSSVTLKNGEGENALTASGSGTEIELKEEKAGSSASVFVTLPTESLWCTWDTYQYVASETVLHVVGKNGDSYEYYEQWTRDGSKTYLWHSPSSGGGPTSLAAVKVAGKNYALDPASEVTLKEGSGIFGSTWYVAEGPGEQPMEVKVGSNGIYQWESGGYKGTGVITSVGDGVYKGMYINTGDNGESYAGVQYMLYSDAFGTAGIYFIGEMESVTDESVKSAVKSAIDNKNSSNGD